jgi:hypothetical protein
MMGKRRGTAQITTASAGSLRSQLSTQKPALLNSLARCVRQMKHASCRNEDASLEHPSQGLQSVQRKATKKRQIANGERLLKTNLARLNRERSKKRKEPRKRQKNLKKAAEEGTAHIDEMLEYKSETVRS